MMHGMNIENVMQNATRKDLKEFISKNYYKRVDLTIEGVGLAKQWYNGDTNLF